VNLQNLRVLCFGQSSIDLLWVVNESELRSEKARQILFQTATYWFDMCMHYIREYLVDRNALSSSSLLWRRFYAATECYANITPKSDSKLESKIFLIRVPTHSPFLRCWRLPLLGAFFWVFKSNEDPQPRRNYKERLQLLHNISSPFCRFNKKHTSRVQFMLDGFQLGSLVLIRCAAITIDTCPAKNKWFDELNSMNRLRHPWPAGQDESLCCFDST